MRVIRTEMYFAPDKIGTDGRSAHAKNPGIGVAWFNLGRGADFHLADLRSIRVIDRFSQNEELAARFVQFALADGRARDWSRNAPAMLGLSDFADYVMRQEIVLEESPPYLVPLQFLVKQSPSIAIGTLIGVGAAGASYPLMLVTVPAGIIVVGSAIGISKGLEKGLNKAIERVVQRRFR